MAGHSKWASIKHKKAIVDSRRGAAFTKLARAITVAAREGGGDLEGNPSLATAVQKARDASMPKDNIERAIAKGTGDGADADAIEAVLYEGYGPGGVAVRNRTGSDVRLAFTKLGGSLGEPGSVSYLFEKLGVVRVDGTRWSEDDLLAAIDAGASDIVPDDDLLEVICSPASFSEVRSAVEAGGVEITSSEVLYRPTTTVQLDEDGARKLLRLVETLEDNDDVGAVHANFDIDDDVLERLTAD
ncbi:MAG: YebC/PmpR family DNA-binding transcriptional regulator [Solirubrobacterales bacterium]|nr:YebC/PmpR family DNA-binding transcriptional regulator [Solirubrobacterales bacterium]